MTDAVSMVGFHLECPPNCSLREDSPWGLEASKLLMAGTSYRKIVALGRAEGLSIVLGTLTRHRKHIVPNDRVDNPEEKTAARATNIEILETIIQKGFVNAKNWKPTISDTMKAMDMWFKLTQGNPFDELLDTLASAGIGEENPEAVGETAETAIQPIDDDDGE